MTTGDLVNIHPTELKFPCKFFFFFRLVDLIPPLGFISLFFTFSILNSNWTVVWVACGFGEVELKKQSSCSMQLTNKTTTQCVAFKVKTTNPRKYCVRPNTGVVLPGDSCNVTVTMQAQKEAPLDMQCKDKFLVQTVVVPDGTTSKEVLAEMFDKEAGRVIEDFKLRVVYIPANPPSPVPEGSEEGNSPMASLNEIGSQTASLFDDVSRTFEETNEKSSEAWSMISKLTEEKTFATQQSQKLRLELEMLRKKSSKKQSGGHSLVLMLLVGLLGCVIGYILNRI
ncbi:PapD-like superfamily [Arabidopsis thaliana x Arabidopsis arenosa]|uniref:PapD-like superfamily n=2 Tax=Arabidopsis thaliana x Arabidopsis arenosa TaxID=1240361 RepID=A0A8T1Z450_9BRAS|nr:PapD-like superfamily [Arabidopsis thaliana x Arabidopsis arenosa]